VKWNKTVIKKVFFPNLLADQLKEGAKGKVHSSQWRNKTHLKSFFQET
jgi:hypothetical protein